MNTSTGWNRMVALHHFAQQTGRSPPQTTHSSTDGLLGTKPPPPRDHAAHPEGLVALRLALLHLLHRLRLQVVLQRLQLHVVRRQLQPLAARRRASGDGLGGGGLLTAKPGKMPGYWNHLLHLPHAKLFGHDLRMSWLPGPLHGYCQMTWRGEAKKVVPV